LTLSALLLGLTGLATLLSALLLPALLAWSALSGLSALLALLPVLTTLLTVFLHIVCHEHSSDAVRSLAALPADFSLQHLVAATPGAGWDELRFVPVTR
jgi:hypothetical protein